MLGTGVGRSKHLLFVSVALAVIGLLAAPIAPAASDPNVGFDISWPQCNGAFPSGGAFGIVGVNGGKPYGGNPCLGVGDGPSELSWAGMNAQLYANTADPGPALSSHWPNGQSSPKPCNTGADPGSDSPECHYDYGWNAAADSYRDAVKAYVSLGWAPAGATKTPVANQWWLDVETANSWTSTPSLNVQALLGERDYLTSIAAAGVGFYSSAGDWQTITAYTTTFASSPSWLAGASSLSDAQSRCGGSGFTGGRVALVQYPSGGFDGDYRCTAQPVLSFATVAQTLTAGTPSGPIGVQLSQPASAALTLTVASSSMAGSFATSTSGPWSTSLSLPIAAGASSSAAFYYQDTKAGSPTLTASASGYTGATQVETIKPAALATLAISPGSAQLRVGTSTTFRATGSDRYGNEVAVTPSWSMSPVLGKFTPNPANPTSFSATTVGTGTITANVAGITGSASISVLAKKGHAGTGAISGASLRVSPTIVAPGGRVRVSGRAPRCRRGDTVLVLSRAFPGRGFAELGAIRTHLRAHGVFTVIGYVRRNARAGMYLISARCDGRDLGIIIRLRVM